MRAALYCRVSTTDQNNEVQRKALSEYAAGRGWSPEIFEDQLSGAKSSRPGLDALMAAVSLGRFDVVLVWKLDRFGRSMLDTIGNIKTLQANGVRFMAITQGIDTDENNAAARMFMSMLAVFAEFERELGRERQRAGIAARRLKGLHMGRLPKVFRRDLVPELRRQGLSIRRIAKELNVSVATVHGILALGKVATVSPSESEAKAAVSRVADGSLGT